MGQFFRPVKRTEFSPRDSAQLFRFMRIGIKRGGVISPGWEKFTLKLESVEIL